MAIIVGPFRDILETGYNKISATGSWIGYKINHIYSETEVTILFNNHIYQPLTKPSQNKLKLALIVSGCLAILLLTKNLFTKKKCKFLIYSILISF